MEACSIACVNGVAARLIGRGRLALLHCAIGGLPPSAATRGRAAATAEEAFEGKKTNGFRGCVDGASGGGSAGGYVREGHEEGLGGGGHALGERGKGGGDVGLWGGHGEGGDCVVVSDEACVSMMHTSVRYGGLAHSGVRLRDSSRALFQHVTVYSTLLAY